MLFGTKAIDPVAAASDMANPEFLAASMLVERAPDIVEAINDMPAALAAAVLLQMPAEQAIEVLDQPGLDREPELITLMPRAAAASLLAGVSADRVADIFHHVKEPCCSELLDLLDADTRVNIQHLLAYPAGTAGSIMTTEFASVSQPTRCSRRSTISVTSKIAARPFMPFTC
jgi:magnesium transporter